MALSGQFLQDRITKTQSQIIAYEDAIDALVVQGVERYRLDTGQSITDVTKLNLAALNQQLGALENRLATLCARANGSGVTHVRPVW